MIDIDSIVFVPRPYGEDFNVNIRKKRAAATARLSVEKVEQVWQRDCFNYVGPRGANGKPHKYARVLTHLMDRREIWRPMLDLRIPSPNAIRFSEGRHTFAALRDMGAVTVEFAVPAEYLDLLLEHYGYAPASRGHNPTGEDVNDKYLVQMALPHRDIDEVG